MLAKVPRSEANRSKEKQGKPVFPTGASFPIKKNSKIFSSFKGFMPFRGFRVFRLHFWLSFYN